MKIITVYVDLLPESIRYWFLCEVGLPHSQAPRVRLVDCQVSRDKIAKLGAKILENCVHFETT